jgi:hypothetical protein
VTSAELWPWVLVALLGAYHGLNPAMGWLFAVGLGLQDRSRAAVLRALGPIALGHELALGLVALLVVGLGVLASPDALRLGAAGVLVAFGVWRLARPRRGHPRWVRFRVSRRELTWWSFLMSSAHGAGLMVAPALLGLSAADTGEGGHDHVEELRLGALSVPESALALLLHVGAMVAVMAVVAVLVYDRLGVRVVQRAWLNTDQIWAGSFVLAGVLTLVT